MLESGSSGSVRGVLSNEHPYREPGSVPAELSDLIERPLLPFLSREADRPLSAPLRPCTNPLRGRGAWGEVGRIHRRR